MEDVLKDISHNEVNGDSQISRRDFLRGAAVVGAGAVVAGVSSACGVENKQEGELLGDPEGVFVNSEAAGFTVDEEHLYTIAQNRNYMSILEGGVLDFPGEEFDLIVNYSEEVFPTIGLGYMAEADGKRRNGQISPFLYSVPSEMVEKTVKLSPYVFATPDNGSKDYIIDPNKKYFFMPIVCEGDPEVSLVPKGLDKEGRPIPQEKIDSDGSVLDREKRQKGFDILPTDRGMQYDRGHWGMYLTEVVNEDGKLKIKLLGILDSKHIYFHPDVLSDDMKNVEYNNANIKVGEE